MTLENIRIRYEGGGTADDAVRQIPEKESSYPSGRMFGTLPAYAFFCRHVKKPTASQSRCRVLRRTTYDRHWFVTTFATLTCSLFAPRQTSLRRRSSDSETYKERWSTAAAHRCPSEAYLQVEGKQSQAIAVVHNDLRKAAHAFVRTDDASVNAVHVDKE